MWGAPDASAGGEAFPHAAAHTTANGSKRHRVVRAGPALVSHVVTELVAGVFTKVP
jgi:hypothetical protein